MARFRRLRALVAPLSIALAFATATLAGSVEIGFAQRNRTVVRVLNESRDFRARVRAALALGSGNDRSATPHLVRALRDSSPAVRAAAATALGRLGDPAAVAPLRRLSRDRERVVRREAERAIRRIGDANPSRPPSHHARAITPGSHDPGSSRMPTIEVAPRSREIYWPRVRYVVVLGSMEDRSNFRAVDLGQALSAEVSRNLLVLRGVAVLREGSITAEARREIQRRNIPKLRLEGSVNRIERRTQRRQLSVRCEVSIMLLAEPGRAIRSVMNGAATGTQPARGRRRNTTQERTLANQALSGAVRSAMSGAARAIAAAGRH